MSTYVEKRVSFSDISDKFSVPIDWLGPNLLPNIKSNTEVEILAQDHLGMKKSYTFTLKTRPEGNKKPFFQVRGWHDFVKDNKLRVDETVYFWKETADGKTIGVQARVEPDLVKMVGFSAVRPA